jgi:hypothetical protein
MTLMLDGLGALFAPTAENAEDAVRRGGLAGLPAAIKILSLRLPKFVGARGLSPQQGAPGTGGMLTPPAGGDFGGSVLETLYRVLSGASAPDPVIVPGVGNSSSTLADFRDAPETLPGPEPRLPGRVPRPPSRPSRFGGSTL